MVFLRSNFFYLVVDLLENLDFLDILDLILVALLDLPYMVD